MIENLLYLYLRTVLARSWNDLMAATREPARLQEARLIDIVSRNADTVFGREYGFSEIDSLEEFRRRVPVRGYDAFEPYIERMCSGEEAVLTVENPRIFGRTSGTTGRPKLIPITPSYYEEFSTMQKMWQRKLVGDHRGMLRGKILTVMSPEVEGYTDCGIPYGALSGHSYRLQYPIARAKYAIPYDVMRVTDFEAKYYLILRLAVEKNVTVIAALNPSTILLLMRKLNAHLPDLVRDIWDGVISRAFDTPPRLRRTLEEGLRPNARLAARLEALAGDGVVSGTDVWENLAVITTWQGGPAGFYLREFPKYFPGAPIRDMGLVATEGFFSFPLESGSPDGLLAIGGHYFEFFPVKSDGGRSETALGCEEVEEGEQYYIVVTTSGGLYRYDIRDIVKVVGFHEKTPMIAFMQKGDNTISITGEKVTEAQALEAMAAAAASMNVAIEGFVLALKLGDPPSHALIVEPAPPGEFQSADFLAAFERELKGRNVEYVSKRESQRLGAPELWLLEAGFFERLRKESVSRGALDGQYKICHVAPDPDFLDGVRPMAKITMPTESR